MRQTKRYILIILCLIILCVSSVFAQQRQNIAPFEERKGRVITVDNPVAYGLVGLTEGSVLFIDPNGFVTEDNANFYYYDANDTLAVENIISTSLTASRLVSADPNEKFVSVSDLTAWIAGTSNQITVTDDSDGTVTLSLPQDIHTGAGPTFDTLTLSSIAAEATDVDKFLVDSTGLIKYRTGAQVLSDIGGSGSAHLHDGDTLQHDGVNSDGGAFSFTTTGTVTFNQAIASAGVTISTGNAFVVGTTTWTSSDEIDGTKIKDADYGDVVIDAGGAWNVQNAETTTVADTDDTTSFVALWESATGNLGSKSDPNLTYNAATGTFSSDAVVIDGTKAIGLDMSGGTFATAVQKWPAGTIQSTGDIVYQPTADSTTGYQWLDADGGTPILNIDTTNERVGIGTSGSPTAALQMGDDKLIAFDVNSGLTASTTQTQGQGALTAQANEISTVANDDDTVTLPSAVTGITIEIINNGANTLQIFPASGDDLGLGVNVAEELEANESVGFIAYDTTNWAKESTTEIIHAEIHDEDNTDAFVINDAGGDFHSYHTNGLAAGDLVDWTFDAGGAGTSHAITGIVAAGGDITVTTGDAHNLAVGDIISQTNLTDAAYVGIFDVLTVPTTTTYTVTATYTATGTGTMEQAATIAANAVAAGVYSFAYYISAVPVGNNETFDFQLYKEATVITGSKIRRKFGASGDFGSMSAGGVVAIANGDKISLATSNEDTAANLTIRNITLVLIRL